MICNSCNKEFDNINGLKFCPYCGTKIEEAPAVNNEEPKETNEEVKRDSKFDTMPMPVITKEEIRNYQKEKFLKEFKKPFKEMKIAITVITAILFIAVGVIGYMFLSGKPVDESRVKNDITGKSVVLPTGTNFEIKKGYIKSFRISERNTDKGNKKDDIKAAVTLSNDTIEVKTLMTLQYIYEGKGKWTISDKFELSGDTTVKPLAGMAENQILEEVKKLNIMLGNKPKALSDADVKTLTIASRTPDFDNLKEVVLVDATIDSGLIAASGKIKCSLVFENDLWKVASVERENAEDFALTLSPSFSEEKIMEAIKSGAADTKVSSPNVFGGQLFYVSDSFTKKVTITDKKFDAQNQNLVVTVKSENTAGELKTVLSTEYTFAVAVDKVQVVKKSKTTVDTVTVSELSKDFIVSTITGREIEGNYLFYLFSSNHKITSEEAKTYKTTKVLFKKGLENVKYVYGSISYTENKKLKTTNMVATYFLVYDKTKGYSWKLDRVVGEDSPNYKLYSPELR
jgi:preprotein translocase subunit Sss1